MVDSVKDLVNNFLNHSAEENDLGQITKVLSVGLVVDNDDPLQQGRLRVFCPSYNDDPKKILHIPWAGYVSPVAGVIDNKNYARGHIADNEKTTGAVHYGFWAIPEIGAHALVACINGDPRRRVWLGCLPAHQETHTLGNGRWRHGTDNPGANRVDGPLSSTRDKIQPTAFKLQEAFNDELDSSEWKTRGVDYQITTVTEPPTPEKDRKGYVDNDQQSIKGNEQDSWAAPLLGDHGYDWTGYKNLGAFLASRVQSWSTPGFHSIQMDDRAFNSRIRIRTTGGSQIILDDTNERMYFSVSGGKSWLEMDGAGNVDIFAERRMSIHSGKDLNFSADESIRLKAGTFISMYAGDVTGQTAVPEQVDTGEIRIHASNDLHMQVDNDLHMNVKTAFLAEVNGNLDFKIDKTFNLISGETMWLEAEDGGIHMDANDQNIEWRVSGFDTSVNTLVDYLNEYVAETNAHVDTYNDHTHPYIWGHSPGASNTQKPNQSQSDATDINDDAWPANPEADAHETRIAIWTNRVPEHEPWPRVLKQDRGDAQNTSNNGYTNNVDWIDQFTNEGTAGRVNVGKVEGDEAIERGTFWRR